MGLPWIRLDTAIADHPKMLDLADSKAFQAMATHLLAMTYAGKVFRHSEFLRSYNTNSKTGWHPSTLRNMYWKQARLLRRAFHVIPIRTSWTFSRTVITQTAF